MTDRAQTRLRNGYGRHKKPITICGHELTARVSLGRQKTMLIDLADVPLLENHSFYAHQRNDGQWVARSSQTSKYAHRMITADCAGYEVDHVNHRPLDNRRGNLRGCTSSQNSLAKSQNAAKVDGYVGIRKVQERRQYQTVSRGWSAIATELDVWSIVSPSGALVGRYKDPSEAARARDELYIDAYGDCDALWHSYNFITWNADMASYGEVQTYEAWLEHLTDEARQEGLEWLLSQRYGSRLVSAAEANMQAAPDISLDLAA